jgi:glycosyltransferase involved in cell wall biosynthesis
MKLSIIIPCFNEEENIPLILERFAGIIDRYDVEVILVNNGSQDNTGLVMAELVPNYPFARITTVDINQGYGHGILSGLAVAKGEYLGWLHADMQTDPYDSITALELIESLKNPTDIFIKGCRKGRPLSDNLFTIGMSIFESLYLGYRMWDINGQPSIFHRSFYDSWINPPHDFSLDLFAFYMAKHNGLRVKRFPVVFPERIHGESSWNSGLVARWNLIKRTIAFSIDLKRQVK